MEEVKIKKPNRKKAIIIISVIVAVAIIIAIVALSTGDSSIPTGNIGDSVVNSDGVTFKVDKVENTKKLGDDYFNDKTSNNFVLITLTVTNTSKKTKTIYGSCIDLYNEAGTKLECFSTIVIDYIIVEDLNPGISKTFQVAFETSTKTTDETYIAKIGYSYLTSNSDRVNITLK